MVRRSCLLVLIVHSSCLSRTDAAGARGTWASRSIYIKGGGSAGGGSTTGRSETLLGTVLRQVATGRRAVAGECSRYKGRGWAVRSQGRGLEGNRNRGRLTLNEAVQRLRGGQDVEEVEEEEGGGEGEGEPVLELKLIVATAKVSSYVDQKLTVVADTSWTVEQLKLHVSKHFTAKPPVVLIRLFRGPQALDDPQASLKDVMEGMEAGRSVPILLDMAPPIDPTKFDADNVVPSKLDGQLEAFASCLAVQHQMQSALLDLMREGRGGEEEEEGGGGGREGGTMLHESGALAISTALLADYEATRTLLERTHKEVPEVEESQAEKHGPIHELLRPLARQFDIEWKNTAALAVFLLICARFGAEGYLRELMTTLLVPAVFLYQTRWAKVARKIGFNLIPLVPGLPGLIVALLPAPEQMLVTFDDEKYVRDMYGPGGPVYHSAWPSAQEEGEGAAGDGGGSEAARGGEGSDEDVGSMSEECTGDWSDAD